MNIFDSLYAWSAIGLLPLNVMLDTVSQLLLEGSSYGGNIDWNNIVKKEARGINNEDLGEVQEVTQDYVLLEKGVINREKLYIPRDLAVGYNGTILIFNISEEDE